MSRRILLFLICGLLLVPTVSAAQECSAGAVDAFVTSKTGQCWPLSEFENNESISRMNSPRGEALVFDEDSYVTLPGHVLGNGSDFTISLWLRPNVTEQVTHTVFMTDSYNYWLRVAENRQLHAVLYNTEGDPIRLYSKKTLENDRWYYITLVYSSRTESATLLVDGESVITRPTGSGIQSPEGTSFLVGNGITEEFAGYSGGIGSIEISATALSQSEARDRYSDQKFQNFIISFLTIHGTEIAYAIALYIITFHYLLLLYEPFGKFIYRVRKLGPKMLSGSASRNFQSTASGSSRQLPALPTRGTILNQLSSSSAIILGYALLVYLKYNGRTIVNQLGHEELSVFFVTSRKYHLVSFLGYIILLILVVRWYTERREFDVDRTLERWREQTGARLRGLVANPVHATILIAILLLALSVRLRSLSLAGHFPDSFIQPILADKLASQSLFKTAEATPLPVDFNWELPGGQWYPRGWPYTIILAGSISMFGSTDFAVRLPGILLGTASVFLAYRIAKTTFDDRSALLAALLLATSGWSIAISSYIRHYVLYEFAFLLATLAVMRAATESTTHRILFAAVAIAFLVHTHLQAIVPASLLILWLALVVLIPEESRHERISGLIFASSLILFGVVTLSGGLQNSTTAIKQLSGYHLPLVYWLPVLLGVVYVMLSNRRVANANWLSSLFLLVIVAITFLIEFTDRPLFPRYTTIVYPLFVVFISRGLVEFLDNLRALKPARLSGFPLGGLVSAMAVGAAIVLVISGFYLPLADYSTSDVWPQNYNTETNELETLQKDRTMRFGQAYVPIVESGGGSLDPPAAVLSNGVNDGYWYTNVNNRTKSSVDFYWLSNYTFTSKWTFRESSPEFESESYPLAPNTSRHHRLTGVPTVRTVAVFEQLRRSYPRGYVIVSKDYDNRISPELWSAIRERTVVVEETDEIIVLRWGE